jgi:hypothetical protein
MIRAIAVLAGTMALAAAADNNDSNNKFGEAKVTW